MDAHFPGMPARTAGILSLAGSACAVTGAALWVASGADIDMALAAGTMVDYLVQAGETRALLVANLVIWILMVLLMGPALLIMADFGSERPLPALAARFCVYSGIPLVLAAYVAWLAVVVQIAPGTSPESVAVAEVVGWVASRADWIATILVIGVGPTFLSVAGRDVWVPNWLLRWGYVTAFASLLNAIAMLTGGDGLSTYGFLIIPAGVGWMIAAGVTLLRKSGKIED